MSVETLSSAQRDVYNALQAGKDKTTIIREFGLTEGTFAAQCTRIRNKGIQIPGVEKARLQQPNPKPVATGPGSSRQIIDEAFDAGEATYDAEQAIAEAQKRGDVHGDMAVMHPMAVMGCTIQFMRLCGGRFHAHQVIEDVYAALRTFTGDGPSPDDVVASATSPFRDMVTGEQITKEDMNQFLDKMGNIKEELETFTDKLQPVSP